MLLSHKVILFLFVKVFVDMSRDLSERNVAKVAPYLVDEWDFEKNSSVPEKIFSGTIKKYWWKCESGHSWEASPNSRVQGNGCPYCSGARVLPGVTDFGTVYPEYRSMWDEANNKKPIEKTSATTGTVYLICEKGHHYSLHLSSIARLYARGQIVQCVVCSGKRVEQGINDFATHYPQFVKYLSPSVEASKVFYKKSSTIPWVCGEGHEFNTSIAKAVEDGVFHCPYCERKKVLSGFNDVLTAVGKDIEKLWGKSNSNPPESTIFHEDRCYYFHCDDGHVWSQSVDAAQGVSSIVCSRCILAEKQKAAKTKNTVLTIEKPKDAKSQVVNKKDDKIPDKNFGTLFDEGLFTGMNNSNFAVLSSESSKSADVIEDNEPSEKRVYDKLKVAEDEKEIYSFVKSILPEDTIVLSKDRSVLGSNKLDIYVPEKQIAIDYNGLYGHSENGLLNHFGANSDVRNYHYNKWKDCKDAGIQLITIWEDEWRDKPEIVKSLITHKLGVSKQKKVYARNVLVVDIDVDTARDFCAVHHIQGFAAGTKYFALVNKKDLSEIYAVSVWRKNNTELYLDRYCTAVNVVGGMGKLLKAGREWGRSKGCVQLITFADHQVSNGGLYESLGFAKDKELRPDYRYLHEGLRKHKFGFRLKRFRNDPALKYVEGYTEKQLAELNDLYRIWDFGKARYVIDLSE